MKRFSQKFQLFIFGLSVGLLIGCLFFIFKIDDFFGKISLFEKDKKGYVSEELVKEEGKDSDQKTSSSKAKKKTNTDVKVESDSESNVSDHKTTAYSFTQTVDEDINVLKEELIGVKNINVKDLAGKPEYKSVSDSVLSDLSGISAAKKNDFFMIEFWKTPLNSKGYKMTRNRVLIYGLKENQDLTMVKLDDDYYLKNNSEVYRLNYSTDFKPMEKVNETGILQKLNF